MMRSLEHWVACAGLAFAGSMSCHAFAGNPGGEPGDVSAAHAEAAVEQSTDVGKPAVSASGALRFLPGSDGLPAEGRWKSRPVFADFDADGHLDLAAHPRLDQASRAWLGDGEGGWTVAADGLQMMEPSCGGGLDVADVNGDGNPDLVVADHCQGLYVYTGDGKGEWKPATIKLAPAIAMQPSLMIGNTNPFRGAEGVAVGDINGDGHADLIGTASDRGGFSVWLGDGSGMRWEETTTHGLPTGANRSREEDSQLGGWANDLLLHDMDGDGHLDLVATYYLGPRVWRGDGEGGFSDWSEGLERTTDGGLFRRIAVGDLNGDGAPDLAASRIHGAVAVYLQAPDGGFRDVSPEFEAVSIGSEGVALGDLDDDGRAELVVAARRAGNRGFGVEVLRLRDGGGWEAVPAQGLPGAGLQVIWGIGIADVDEDGRNDLAMTLGGDTFAPSEEAAVSPPLPHVQVWLNRSRRAHGATGAVEAELRRGRPAVRSGSGRAAPVGSGNEG